MDIDNKNVLWYKNPIILFTNLDQFYPSNNLNFIEKVNSLARLALYFFLIIIIFSLDKNWYYIIIILLLISYNFSDYKKSNYINTISYKCKKPTENNPFINSTLQDNSNSKSACQYDDIKNDMKKYFRKIIHTDLTDIWGKNISDRNFYTMPNTNIVNKQTEFANWCYDMKNSGACKTLGKNCIYP